MSQRAGDTLLAAQRAASTVRAAKTIAGLGALGCALSAATLLTFDEPHLRQVGWVWLAIAGLSGACFAALLLGRLASRGAQVVSMVVLGAVLVSQVHADWNSALARVHFAAFDGFKIVAVAVATVLPFAPTLSFVLVASCAVLPVALSQLMTPAMLEVLPIEEPWNTLIFPVIATGILLHRMRTLRLEQQVIGAVAEREALERFARVSLAYRDLANSPLQALELTRSMLQQGQPGTDKLVAQLERSLSRLRELGEILSRTEGQVTWTSSEESFDAAAVIAEYHRQRPGGEQR